MSSVPKRLDINIFTISQNTCFERKPSFVQTYIQQMDTIIEIESTNKIVTIKFYSIFHILHG